jgi:hypothetical protein
MRSQRYKTRDREKLHTNFAMNVRSQCLKNLFIVDGLIKTNDYLSKGWFRVLRDQINSDYIFLRLANISRQYNAMCGIHSSRCNWTESVSPISRFCNDGDIWVDVWLGTPTGLAKQYVNFRKSCNNINRRVCGSMQGSDMVGGTMQGAQLNARCCHG